MGSENGILIDRPCVRRKNALARVEELEAETRDLNGLMQEAAAKFAALGYTWVRGGESHGISFL